MFTDRRIATIDTSTPNPSHIPSPETVLKQGYEIPADDDRLKEYYPGLKSAYAVARDEIFRSILQGNLRVSEGPEDMQMSSLSHLDSQHYFQVFALDPKIIIPFLETHKQEDSEDYSNRMDDFMRLLRSIYNDITLTYHPDKVQHQAFKRGNEAYLKQVTEARGALDTEDKILEYLLSSFEEVTSLLTVNRIIVDELRKQGLTLQDNAGNMSPAAIRTICGYMRDGCRMTQRIKDEQERKALRAALSKRSGKKAINERLKDEASRDDVETTKYIWPDDYSMKPKRDPKKDKSDVIAKISFTLNGLCLSHSQISELYQLRAHEMAGKIVQTVYFTLEKLYKETGNELGIQKLAQIAAVLDDQGQIPE